MNACDHPWWIEGDYTDATCKACGVPGWYCPACSPDPDDDADEDCTTCGGSGYVVVHELIARLTRELEEARELLRELAGGDEAGLAWDSGWRCVYCDSSALYVVSHDGDCPIVRARRALATDMEGQP